MLRLRKSNTSNGCANGGDEESADSDDEVARDTELKRTLERIQNCPFEIEDLQVQSFGIAFNFPEIVLASRLAFKHHLICCLLHLQLLFQSSIF